MPKQTISAMVGAHHLEALRQWGEREGQTSPPAALRQVLDGVRERVGMVEPGAWLQSYRGNRGPALPYVARKVVFSISLEQRRALHRFGEVAGEPTQSAALRRLLDMVVADVAA